MTKPVKGERFCGRRLAHFLSRSCQEGDKVSLKSMKWKLILYKMVRFIPDMSAADKRHLIRMFTKVREPRSATHMPAWLKQLEEAEISESESSLLERLIMNEISKERQHSSPKHHPLLSARHRRGTDIVEQCCNNECDIDEIRRQYCAATR